MKHLTTTMITILCATAVLWADGAPDKEYEAQVEYAHKALQEAVELVEVTHSPTGNVYFSKGEALRAVNRRPRIGVVIRTRNFGDEPAGAVIDAVTPGGPADDAGLVAGDVITHVDGEPLVSNNDGDAAKSVAAGELVKWSLGLTEGQRVTIDYVRDNTPSSVTLEAREMEGNHNLLRPFRDFDRQGHGGDKRWFLSAPGAWTFPSAWLDMELVSLNPELGEYFSTDRGVLVVRGPEDASLGLEAGDVILAIDGREVRDPSHAMRILRSYEPDEELGVDIVRHGRSQTLTGTVPRSSVTLPGNLPWSITESE